VAFYSGYNKWYRPFLQRLCYSFGSVNYGSESSSCFTSTILSWKCATGAEMVQPDLGNAGVFLGFCANPGISSYLMNGGLQANRKRGMKVIIIDPRITPASQNCDLHLRIRPGTDGALALCLGRELIRNGWIDQDYIQQHVHGFPAYRDYVEAFTPEVTANITGLSPEDIRLAAKLVGENLPLAINPSNASLVHFKNGMQNHRAVMALSAITGSYDRKGGMIPTYLTYAHSIGGFETLEPEFSTELYPKDGPIPIGCERYPLWHQLIGEMQACDLPRAILTKKPYGLQALYAHGMNFRMFPGSKEMEEALRQLPFFVDVDLFLTDSAKYADIVLPACTSYERGEFKVFGGGYAQYTEAVIPPLFEARRDDEIILDLARRLGVSDTLITSDPDTCIRYMLRNTPIDLKALKHHPELPQKIPGLSLTPVGEHGFATPTGKFELDSVIIRKLQDPKLDSLPTYRDSADDADPQSFPLLLSTGIRIPGGLHSRLHDCPSARSLRPQVMADISPEDAEHLGIVNGDKIRIVTGHSAVSVRSNVTGTIPQGMVSLYHGYREADANSLLSYDHRDPYSGFPGYRCIRCRIEKED
jgi:anaerobic selenocysteine-containing dehydrogenase